jgi:NAD(P)H-binding
MTVFNSSASYNSSILVTNESTKIATTALVFGASGEQGRAVVEGLQDNGGYATVFAFTREKQTDSYLEDGLNAIVIVGDVQKAEDVRKALLETKASSIFFVTTTDLPTEIGQTTGFSDAADRELQVIILFFQLLKECYEQDNIPRHVVFSIRDNVQDVTRQVLESTGDLWISPLDDGSIVPHYSAKGKGGEYATEYLKCISQLKLTLITIPFLFSNFLGFFTPLPDERRTQWMLTACFGDGRNKIDMMAASDLSYIVRKYFL